MAANPSTSATTTTSPTAGNDDVFEDNSGLTEEQIAEKKRLKKEAKKERKELREKQKAIIANADTSSPYGHFSSDIDAYKPKKPISEYHTTDYVQPEEYRFYGVAIDDPITVGTGMSAFTAFRLTCQSTDAEFQPEVCVRLRYSQFFDLYQNLVNAHPNMLVPEFPPKQWMGRFASDFVEKRMAGLEKFMELVVTHAVFGKSEFVTQLFRNNIEVPPPPPPPAAAAVATPAAPAAVAAAPAPAPTGNGL